MGKGTQYVCQSCGAVHSKWSGKCDSCGNWNTLVEQLSPEGTGKALKSAHKLSPEKIVDIKHSKDTFRISTGIKEADQVLGGGFVDASINLIAGEPGIGKSTILLQIAHNVAKKHKVLYVSAEESAMQIKLRSQRLGTDHEQLEVVTSTITDDIAATIQSGKYKLVVVDSIQTIATSAVASGAGSVSQITNSSQLLSKVAKASDTALVIVGHVTKQGNIAGPKILEHLVDVVMNLEGDRYGGFKLLRCIKNRYGSTNEAGIFEMTDKGLTPVDNPSAALLSERQVSDGSVVLATMEGTRPLLVEVQALVTPTNFGYPKRTASGFDLNRLNLLIAMLSRRTKLNLGEKDVFINIVGGIKAQEPAADLAVCMAVASAAKGMELKDDAVVFGEVGLSGEVRHVQAMDKRVAEAKKLGFKAAIGPRQPKKSSFIHEVKTVRDALNSFLSAS